MTCLVIPHLSVFASFVSDLWFTQRRFGFFADPSFHRLGWRLHRSRSTTLGAVQVRCALRLQVLLTPGFETAVVRGVGTGAAHLQVKNLGLLCGPCLGNLGTVGLKMFPRSSRFLSPDEMVVEGKVSSFWVFEIKSCKVCLMMWASDGSLGSDLVSYASFLVFCVPEWWRMSLAMVYAMIFSVHIFMNVSKLYLKQDGLPVLNCTLLEL